MSTPIRDARVRELAFLAYVERAPNQRRVYESKGAHHVERQMVMYLVQERYFNASDTRDEIHHYDSREREMRQIWAFDPVELRLGHKGRLRLSELEQALSTGRDRDPTGIFVGKRYLDRDLTIALVRASVDEPVSLAIADMNGLKTMNDTHGHGAGDEAIKTYLATVAAFLPEGATGYRGEGGDEVFIIGRSVTGNALADAMRTSLLKLRAETVQGVSLSASCGVRSTVSPDTDAAALTSATDKAQYRAKEASRSTEGRRSTLAIEDLPVEYP
jgi:diguanylate cyclase (GGDEF)-like protein